MRNFKQLIVTLKAIILISIIGPSLNAQSNSKDYIVNFKSQQILPENNVTDFQQSAASVDKAKLNGHHYVLIQFNSKQQLKDLQELKRHNIELSDYLGSNAYLAAVPESIDEDQLVKLNTRSISVIPANVKLSAGIQSGETPQWASQKSGQVALNVMIHRKANLTDAIRRIQQEGGSVTSQKFAKYGILQVSIAQSNINALAENGFVKSVEFIEAPLEHLNHKGPQSTRSSVEASLYGNRGKGVVVGVGDGGVVDHVDLDGALLHQPSGPAVTWGDHPHHIAGTIGGKGTIDPWFTGMAPEADLIIDYTSNVVLYANQYHDDYGMSITNNSYGPGNFKCHTSGEYNSNSYWLDENSLERDKLLHIFAAGNSGDNDCSPFPYGYGTLLRSYASSKNPLIVGAIQHRGQPTFFSSIGPVKDGRIKPEVVASGFGVSSTGRSNNYIAYMGTSMATATASGAAAVISGVYKKENGSVPEGDLLKAIMMNTADDGGIVGPDYQYGFGMLNVNRASEVIRNQHYVTGTINQGEAKQQIINVPAGAAEVKIMLYWHDDPKAGIVTNALVNDMDLEATNNTGTTYLPYVLDHTPANVMNPATRQVDTLNNVEQVVLSGNEITSQITLTVKGSVIPNGARRFVIVYDVVMPEVQMTYPAGGESMVPDDRIEIIRWSSYGVNSEDVTLELSLDNGNAWINMPLTADNKKYKYYNWSIPANFRSEHARFKITNTVNDVSHINAIPFSIIPKPKNLTLVSNCSGTVKFAWDAAPDVARYEVYRKDTVMESLAITEGTTFVVSGLTAGNEEWFSVRAVTASGTKGNRIAAMNVIVDGKACTPTPDIGISELKSPLKDGRQFTSTTLDNQFVEVEITNYGNSIVTNFPISYSINDQPPVTELFSGSLGPEATATYRFNQTLDISTPGEKRINVWTAMSNDVYSTNDRLAPKELVELSNEYLAANEFPLNINFDNAAADCARENTMGFAGISHLDASTNDFGGRINVNSDARYNAKGSFNVLTMDAQNLVNASSATNELIFTFNVADYDANWDGLLLDFDYMTHYQTPNSENKVYVRAVDTDPWTLLYTIEDSQLANGNFKRVEGLDLLDAVGYNSTVNKTTLTTSLQIKFVQGGTEESVDTQGDGGYTIDNVSLKIGSVLPVELVSFNAVKEDKNALLTWQTATELNNSHFNVQVAKETVEGEISSFTTIAKLDGAGTTNVPQAYRFLDEELGKAGYRYYRLQQVDFDGTTAYSQTKVLNFTAHQLALSVYPNPTVDNVTIQLDAQKEGTLEVGITDVTGKLLDQLTFEVEQGLSNNSIDLDGRYTNGMYFINTKIDDAYSTFKIIKTEK